ncbi:MAG: PAS domain S-box protein [Syntrophales bacterium]|nr:PAS domain S-box protein [Syntrophales bacterium]
MKVLYVEDNRLDADLTRRELKKSAPDFLMDAVATQRDALLALEKKPDYDLVLADMRLPDGDGLAILTHIRGRGLPLAVVIITGQGDEETAVTALKAGAQDYVVKREGYRDHLPLVLEKALECYRKTSIRSSQPLRVLYAEPSASDADLTKRHLTNCAPHIQLEIIRSASEVFQILSGTPDDTYQAVLLDYRLSGMNALEILKELRQVSGTDLPIILITGQDDEEVAVQALKLGATDYVVKNPGYLYKIPSVLENAVHGVQLARAHRTVSQLKRQNELILNSAGEGIVGLDMAGNHSFVNRGAARMLGYEISEMVGLHGHSLWHHTKIDGTRYHEEACPIYAACKEGVVLHDQEDLFWKKDGTGFPVECSLMPIFEGDGLLGSVLTFRDITKRKWADAEIRQSEERFRATFEHSTVGKSLTMTDGQFLQTNKAFADMLGYTIEEIQEINFAHITHPDDMAKSWECIRILLAGEQTVYRFEKRYIHKNGDIIWTDVSTTLLHDAQGTPLYLITSIVDITGRKRAEEELRQTLESLRKAFNTTIQVMVSAVEARDPYTAGHQFRSADLARAIATEMKLSEDRIDGIRMAGSIHDIGKLSIPAEILSKPSKLSDIEFSLIQEHPRKGYEMLKDVESPWPLAEIVYQHHERMDGSGYPRNLKGDEIIMEARIMAVADVVEAMASHRPYRPALGIDAALKQIEDNRGILYDADVVDACARLFKEEGYRFE